MKAIFTGTVAGGFGIDAVVEDAAAEDIVIAHLADGRLAEAIDINDPEKSGSLFLPVEGGKHFVGYGKNVGDGVQLVGPFATNDIARAYAEKHEIDDDWALFESNS